MKQKGALIFLSLFSVFFLAGVVRADYASSYQAYVSATGTYQTAFGAYSTARSSYLASGSLDSESKAKDATLKMLQARDNMINNYLNALTSKIQSTNGISDGDKNSLFGQINTEITWYNAHLVKLPSAGSLQDLVSDSDEAKGQWNNSTLIVIYQSLIALGVGNNNYIRGELNGEISTLSSKIAEIKANQDKDTSLIERSVVDVQNKLSRSQDKDNTAKDLINAVKPSSFGTSDNFGSAQQDLLDSNSYLKEANQSLLQIITQIKTN